MFLDCCILHFCYRVTGQTNFKGLQSEFEEVSPKFFQCKTIELHFKINTNTLGHFLKPVWGVLNRRVCLIYSLCSCNNSQTTKLMVVKYYVGEFFKQFDFFLLFRSNNFSNLTVDVPAFIRARIFISLFCVWAERWLA
jgi:hypothetical protein